MKITGQMLIGSGSVAGQQAPIQAINPATGEPIEPVYFGGGSHEVDHACALAESAFDIYRETTPESRAVFLETIATNIEALGDELISRAMAETGLPQARIQGERGRTVGQLHLFAKVVRDGHWLDARIDPELRDRQPPRADLRSRQIPLGPVAVFGASNFPLAFSVAGGDTASALAAAAPVIVKGHSAHPGTAELVGRAIQAAVQACGLPEGTFSLLFGAGRELGAALVADARIKAVGFTGSRSGGQALMQIAWNRPEPIPVYAEMSSINPVFLLPHALKTRGSVIAGNFINSLMMGAGQFCTSPGLVIAIDDQNTAAFMEQATQQLEAQPCQTMLTPTIHDAYEQGIARLLNNPNVQLLGRGQQDSGSHQCRGALFATTAKNLLQDASLSEEVFGSGSLIVKCRDDLELLEVARRLEGQLTATIHAEDSDDEQLLQPLIRHLELKAGRILFNGFPTGVEVCHAMVHGGPWPSTSDSRTTSVGSAAIYRFLRPVCYQDVPAKYLPTALADDNAWNISRLFDGSRQI